MATYKVLQDIEAEDKLLGPLTLKQFIFAAITIVIGFIQFTLITNAALGIFRWPFVLVLIPPMLLFGFLAAPISRDQPNDIWLLARLRFLFKPRQRIWNQDGISELVTITAPKREIHIYTNSISQNEVKSRLNALANTLDSRGWAVKNVNTNLFAEPGYLTSEAESDRLVDPTSLPQDVPIADVSAADDMLDPLNNSTAQHLDALVQASTQAQRSQAISHMRQDDTSPAQATPQDYWFMNQQAAGTATKVTDDFATFQSQQVVAPGTTDVHPAAVASEEEKALAERLAKEHQESLSHVSDHMRVVQPLHNPDGTLTQAALPPQPPATNDVPVIQTLDSQRQTAPNPAIIGLAHNDDLNIATIARQAKEIVGDDEVVISLH